MASGGLSQWDGSDKTEIASHIRQVESYFVVKEIDDDRKKVALLHLSLKGEPKTFFTKLSAAQTDTFAHAKAALEERFKPFKSKAQYQQELAERHQHPGETVIELKFAVIDLVYKAYPEVTESVAQNALVVAHFRNALRPEIRQKLAWTISDGSSLDDVVSRAAQMEQVAGSSGVNAISSYNIGSPDSQQQEKSTSSEASQDRLWKVLNDLTLGQQQLAQTIAVMQAEPRTQRRGSRQRAGNCYNCGAPGHFARDCRRKSTPQVPKQVRLTNLMEFVLNAISGVTNLIPVHFEETGIRETTMGWEEWPTPSSPDATEQAFSPKRDDFCFIQQIWGLGSR